MKNNKGFGLVAVLLIIVGVLIVGGGAYYLGTKNNSVPNSNIVETNLPVNDVVDTNTTNQQVKDEQASVSDKPNLSSSNKSCFIFPQAGATWPAGSTNTIKLAIPPIYESHCSNTFSIINATTNQLVGYLGIQSKMGQSSYPWLVSDTIFSFSCGSSGDSSPAYITLPGQYKLRFTEQDTVNGVGQTVSCESGIFTIN